MHQYLSEVFMITTNSDHKAKTFLYEYSSYDTEKLFTLEDIDLILISRLKLNNDENKFVFLYQSYERAINHLYVKSNLVENVD